MRGSNRLMWVALAAAAFVAALFVHRSEATRPAPSQPAVIAAINLEKVFNGLNVRAEADARLEQLAEELERDAEVKIKEIDQLREETELYTTGSAQHQEALEKYTMASLDYQAYVEFSRRKIEIEKALTLKRIYADIKEAAAAMAAEVGFDIVFVDDSVGAIAGDTEADVNRQISGRRMLFVNPASDVTEDLIARMNTP